MFPRLIGRNVLVIAKQSVNDVDNCAYKWTFRLPKMGAETGTELEMGNGQLVENSEACKFQGFLEIRVRLNWSGSRNSKKSMSDSRSRYKEGCSWTFFRTNATRSFYLRRFGFMMRILIKLKVLA